MTECLTDVIDAILWLDESGPDLSAGLEEALIDNEGIVLNRELFCLSYDSGCFWSCLLGS